MSEPVDSDIVLCDEILLRAILKKRHFSGGQVDAYAFILRPQDEGKLSTWRRRFVTVAACKGAYKTCCGVVTLHTGRVRCAGDEKGLRVDVVADSLPSDPLPGHASVLNLPDPNTDPFLAEFVATKLRDQCRPTS